MTQDEREQLERDYALYRFLQDYYAQNRDRIKSMNDEEYRSYIDAILDAINGIRDLLEAESDDRDETEN